MARIGKKADIRMIKFMKTCASETAAWRSMKLPRGSVSLILTVLLALFLAGCSTKPDAPWFCLPTATQGAYTVNAKTYTPLASADGYWEKGPASWYGKQFHGRITANGEVFNMFAMTAAHKTLPMNTVLLVRNLENGRQTLVRVNDRGPFIGDRILDLSYRAARKIGMADNGIAPIEIIALGETAIPDSFLHPGATESLLKAGGQRIANFATYRLAAPPDESAPAATKNMRGKGFAQTFTAGAAMAYFAEGKSAPKNDPRNSGAGSNFLSYFVEFFDRVTGRFPPENPRMEMHACHDRNRHSVQSAAVPTHNLKENVYREIGNRLPGDINTIRQASIAETWTSG